MIDLYYWPTPNGWKITIALEEMGLPYNLKMIDISKGEQFEPEFLKISPNNRMPAIVDHDGPDGPISVFESGAILQYLAEKTGQFMPTSVAEKYDVLQWLNWQMGGLGPMMGQLSHFGTYAPHVSDVDHSYAVDRYRNETMRLFGVLERRLSDRDYIAGEYSIADMACWPWAMLHDFFDIPVDDFPNMAEWVTRLKDRPAVEKGYQLGREDRINVREEGLTEEAKANLFSKK
ncbi:MAG: glutathione S-transferase N-terminal domain-containing protein [Sphingomonadales bacterium]|nr:glutathione S-transferase N-terminal domain-containing protein [Sphingomonadales bacterium]